jgi:3-hydroxyisobutyrate dehydrogenase
MTDLVGFIGLGTMGLPMATNLAKSGLKLLAWNRSEKTKNAFPPGCDVDIAGSGQEVLQRSDATILMLLNEHTIDTVLGCGTDAFASNVSNKTIINMGSVDPAYSVGLAGDIATAGGRYVEAPVSGSKVPAEKGELVCLLGGDQALVERFEPVLNPMCSRQIYCGSVGDALRMKLAVNIYLCSSLVALAEAVNFAMKAELPLERFAEAMKVGPFQSAFLAIKLPKLISQDFSKQAAVSDAYGITRLIQTEAGRINAAVPQLDISSDLYGCAVDQLGPHGDMSSVLHVLDNPNLLPGNALGEP